MSQFDEQFSRVASLREVSHQDFKVQNTMTFWHGGNLGQFDDTIAQKNGRYEYGPGLYLTEEYVVAQKYAKGGRKMYLVTVAKGVDINDAMLGIDDAIGFVKAYVMAANRKQIIGDLRAHEKIGGLVPAYILMNLILNDKAIRPSNTPALRQFFVDHGVDYEIVGNYGGYGGKMMVLYNMKKIVSHRQYGPKDEIAPEMFSIRN